MPVRYLAQAAGAYSARTVPVSVDNVTDDTPSIGECNTAFGTAALCGAGFIGLINDNGDSLKLCLVASDGTNWHRVAFTKAPLSSASTSPSASESASPSSSPSISASPSASESASPSASESESASASPSASESASPSSSPSAS